MNFILGFTRSESMEILESLGLKPPTPKQLHYWASISMIDVDMITAKTPVYSFQTILDIELIVSLMAFNLSLAQVDMIKSEMREVLNWGKEGIILTKRALMTDGATVAPLDDETILVNLLNGKTTWSGFIVDTETLVIRSLKVLANKNWLDRLRSNERHYLELLR